MKILVLDNYDSFTYNLVHILRELNMDMDIYRNDKISLDEVEKYDKILLSPGPGVPADAGIMPELLLRYGPTKSILGVCLGHQAIAEAFGSQIFNLPEVYHGIATKAIQTSKSESLFEGLPESFSVCRYHSWSVDPNTISDDLVVTAVDEKDNVMAISHKTYNVKGVQFHPESILTEHGKEIIQNWINN